MNKGKQRTAPGGLWPQPATGASFEFEAYWAGIDWASLRTNVRRLQMRTAKAVRARRWGTVKALQWLLSHSWSAKMLAVRRVVTNRGKNTPGVDGALWETSQEKTTLMDQILPGPPDPNE